MLFLILLFSLFCFLNTLSFCYFLIALSLCYFLIILSLCYFLTALSLCHFPISLSLRYFPIALSLRYFPIALSQCHFPTVLSPSPGWAGPCPRWSGRSSLLTSPSLMGWSPSSESPGEGRRTGQRSKPGVDCRAAVGDTKQGKSTHCCQLLFAVPSTSKCKVALHGISAPEADSDNKSHSQRFKWRNMALFICSQAADSCFILVLFHVLGSYYVSPSYIISNDT